MLSGKQLPQVKAGDPFTPRLWNDLVAEVERVSRFSVVGGEGYDLPGGQAATPSRDVWCYAQVTSRSGAAFAWTEKYPAAGGTWTTGPRSGTTTTNPAYEINGTTPTSLPLMTILRYDETSNAWLFQVDSC